MFTVEVQVHGNALAQGTGHSKQEAEREAARNALTELDTKETIRRWKA